MAELGHSALYPTGPAGRWDPRVHPAPPTPVSEPNNARMAPDSSALTIAEHPADAACSERKRKGRG